MKKAKWIENNKERIQHENHTHAHMHMHSDDALRWKAVRSGLSIVWMLIKCSCFFLYDKWKQQWNLVKILVEFDQNKAKTKTRWSECPRSILLKILKFSVRMWYFYTLGDDEDDDDEWMGKKALKSHFVSINIPSKIDPMYSTPHINMYVDDERRTRYCAAALFTRLCICCSALFHSNDGERVYK